MKELTTLRLVVNALVFKMLKKLTGLLDNN